MTSAEQRIVAKGGKSVWTLAHWTRFIQEDENEYYSRDKRVPPSG